MPSFSKSTVKCQLSIVQSKSKGFTLIELLIVITIIGILASLTLASYGGAQAKARDGVRKSDLAQVRRALELAKSDCQGNAYYPYLGGADHVFAFVNLGDYLTNTNLKYISSMPKDPKNSGDQIYGFWISSSTVNVCPATDGSGTLTTQGSPDFAIFVVLERVSDSDSLASRTKCNGIPTWLSPNWTDPSRAGYYVVCSN